VIRLIILGKNAGFCFGVKRAVDVVENNIYKKIVTLGPLIHNDCVVRSFEERGVRCVNNVDEVNKDETVIIRSHGVSPDIYEELDRKGINYIDATCPHVKRIHERVGEAKAKALPVIIIGEAGHPEVEGTIGWAGKDSFIVYTEEEVQKLPQFDKAVVVAQTTITEEKWNGILSALGGKVEEIMPFQSICSTTKERRNEAEEIAKKADAIIVVGGKLSSNTRKLYELCKKYCKNVYYIEHYKELLLEKIHTRDIIGIVAGASTPDSMIREVFDYMTENEKALPIDGEPASEMSAAADMAEEATEAADTAAGEPETVSETPETESEQTEKDKIETSGNTADKPAADAEEKIETSGNTADKPEASAEEKTDVSGNTAEEPEAGAEEKTDVSENAAEEPEPGADEKAKTSENAAEEPEAGADEKAETSENAVEESKSAEEPKPPTEKEVFLEGLEKVVRLKKGQIVKGNVVQITDEDVSVNIGYKTDGIIHKGEISLKEADPKDAFNIGDEIEAEVINLNDGEGNVLLSRKRIEKKLNWLKMKENVGSDTVYTCVVKKAVKGGVTTRVEGYSTFIPASHMDLKYVEDLKQFEGKEIEVTLIDADKRQERLVASHKNVLLKEKREKEDQIWNSFVKGEHIKGVVKRLTDFGAFVDVGGVDGLLHISDIAWSRIKHPSEIVNEGQELELLVLNVDPAKRKIALGYKQLQPKPWDLVPEKYHAGDIVTGKVVRIVPFGAFVQLEPTVDGLIHISQVSKRRLDKVEDELRLGDEVEVKILEVNADKRKISLSRKALLGAEESHAEKREKTAKEGDFKYEIPPVQESKVSLADFFPKKEE
jgi:ribosomal protein S1/(E)-4-hydroxy-3-methyl-but-2-enyl pyrophosphate reductase